MNETDDALLVRCMNRIGRLTRDQAALVEALEYGAEEVDVDALLKWQVKARALLARFGKEPKS